MPYATASRYATPFSSWTGEQYLEAARALAEPMTLADFVAAGAGDQEAEKKLCSIAERWFYKLNRAFDPGESPLLIPSGYKSRPRDVHPGSC